MNEESNRKKHMKSKVKTLTPKEKQKINEKQMAIVIGCDLQSEPDSAAFE